jgi:acetoin utilization deacetylase AcuC-like enzyme
MYVSSYPQGGRSGVSDIGDPDGPARGTTVNVPLPPGSGTGAYYESFDKIVIPALKRFKPHLILVSR